MTASSSAPLLECRNLGRVYADGHQQLEVLKSVNFSIAAGELMAIVGSSGSGKSTLLHMLGGLDKPSTGEVLFRNQTISRWSGNKLADWRNQELGFIYQFHHLLPEFTALENVAMPLWIAGQQRSEALKIAQQWLVKVGLSERQHHRPSELSGGERQRVAIARAVVNEPAVVLADEPTGNLDATTATQVFELMLKLNAELDTAFVIVTHDQSLAAKLPRALQLQQGRLVAAALDPQTCV
ncbi:MAG TPA: lipoprotein-releasing ABC transporter ATP-binding protein LolD [Pseudidiomarina sp.]|nr:lipoprotein-releasing ABC transporter ATP-binding protein LolD [Pseudidiomarina sp.]